MVLEVDRLAHPSELAGGLSSPKRTEAPIAKGGALVLHESSVVWNLSSRQEREGRAMQGQQRQKASDAGAGKGWR